MGALGGVFGGLLGDAAASGDQNTAQQSQQNALNAILGVQAPNLASEQVQLGNESVTGQLNPNLQGTNQLGSNAMANISTNPALMQAQMNALSQLQQLGQGGMTATEKAQLMQNQNSANAAAQAQSSAVMQQMAARGMGGGGAELAAELNAGQGSANRNSANSLQTQAMAQQNALSAMAGAGSLGQSMQAQSFGQQAQQAQAQNAINQFNAAQRQQVAAQNATAQNQAQQYNLSNAQNVANQNTAIQNQNQLYNSQQVSNNYNQQMNKAQNTANQYGGYGNYFNTQAAQTRGEFAQAGAAMGGMGGGSSSGGGASSVDSMGGGLGSLTNNIGGGMMANKGGKVLNDDEIMKELAKMKVQKSSEAKNMQQGKKQIPVPMSDGGKISGDDKAAAQKTLGQTIGYPGANPSPSPTPRNYATGGYVAPFKYGSKSGLPGTGDNYDNSAPHEFTQRSILTTPQDSRNAVSDYTGPGTDNFALKSELPKEDPSRAHLERGPRHMNQGGKVSEDDPGVYRHAPDEIEALINELSMLKLAKGGYITTGDQTPYRYPQYDQLQVPSPHHGGEYQVPVNQQPMMTPGHQQMDQDKKQIPVPMYYGGKIYPAAPQSYSQGGFVTNDQTPYTYPRYQSLPQGSPNHGGMQNVPVNQQPPLSPIAGELTEQHDNRIPVPMSSGGFVAGGQDPYRYPSYQTLPQGNPNHGGMKNEGVTQPRSPIAGELSEEHDNRIPVPMAYGGSIEMRGRGQAKSHFDSMPPMGAANMYRGGLANTGAINMDGGGIVPGSPAVQGDSIKNDMVPAYLSPGEVVVPRTVVNSGDRDQMADAVQHAKPANAGLRKLHALMEMKALHPPKMKTPNPIK